MIRTLAFIAMVLLGAASASAQTSSASGADASSTASSSSSTSATSTSTTATDSASSILGVSTNDVKDKLQQIVSALKGQCWSCEVYRKLHQGSSVIAGDAFNYLTRTAEIAAVAALILMIVLTVKVLKLIGTPFTPSAAAEWSRIYGYFGRIAVVFLFFFGAGAVDAMRGGETISSTDTNPVRLIFIDAPTGIGTEVGCEIIKIATKSGLGSATVASSCENATTQSEWAGQNSESMLKWKHVEQAVAILKGLHEMSVDVISIGVWLATEAPFKVGASNFLTGIAVFLAGIALVGMFFWFSITFGFRYIDALMRTTIVAALMPIFLYLWIFENTRSMAVMALKSLAYVGAVFAASGIVYIMADQIMCAGLTTALGGSCKSVSSAVSAGGFSKLVGENGVAWVAIFILLGTGGLVIQISGTVFALANIIVQSNVSTDAGAGAAASLKGGVGSVVPGMR